MVPKYGEAQDFRIYNMSVIVFATQTSSFAPTVAREASVRRSLFCRGYVSPRGIVSMKPWPSSEFDCGRQLGTNIAIYSMDDAEIGQTRVPFLECVSVRGCEAVRWSCRRIL